VVILAQEAEAKFKFIELKEEATSYVERQTQSHRSYSLLQLAGGPNIEVLKLAFSEFYLNLILLQNYQVSSQWSYLIFCYLVVHVSLQLSINNSHPQIF